MITLFDRNRKYYNQNNKILYLVSHMVLQAAPLIGAMEPSNLFPGSSDNRHVQLLTVGNFEIIWNLEKILRAGKIKFSGAQKSVLLKASSGELYMPRNFVDLPCDFTWYICLPHCVPCAPNEICYGKMKQCSNILQFPDVRAKRSSEKRKTRLWFPL